MYSRSRSRCTGRVSAEPRRGIVESEGRVVSALQQQIPHPLQPSLTPPRPTIHHTTHCGCGCSTAAAGPYDTSLCTAACHVTASPHCSHSTLSLPPSPLAQLSAAPHQPPQSFHPPPPCRPSACPPLRSSTAPSPTPPPHLYGRPPKAGAQADSLSFHLVYDDVMIPMRDGVELAGDLYLPSINSTLDMSRKWPCVLIRTPYDKARTHPTPFPPPPPSECQHHPPTFPSPGHSICVPALFAE